MIELISYLFIANGVFFLLVTAIGMIKFEDFYLRLHIGSKCLTGGGISILLGIVILNGFSLYSLKLLAIIMFLILTNPVTTHALARAGYYNGEIDNLELVQDDLSRDSAGDA